MKLPYDQIYKLNKSLKDRTYIGGWEDQNDVFLYYRENNQRKVIKINDVPRYFCIKKEDYTKISKERWESYKKQGFFKEGYFNGTYGYIISTYTGYKSKVNEFLKDLHDAGIEPLEGDINRVQRLMIDLDLKVTSPNCEDQTQHPKIVFYDIETYDAGKIDIGKDRILSVALKEYDTGQEYFYILDELTDEAEKKFLNEV